ncbi:unnamed protein product [Amoebophrya sp. A25]|nr:unnamed protein product [Amoebophrya sp. A25]|eukprot:GSA25T00004971001.1
MLVGNRSFDDGEEMDSVVTSSSQHEILTSACHVDVRHGFVRKVFGLVACQLALTALIAAPFVVFYDSVAPALIQYQGLVAFVMVFPLLLTCVAMCRPHLLREYPSNYGFLAAMTVSMGVLVGFACMRYEAWSILGVAGLTAGIVAGLGAFAMQTKYDFTGMAPYLFACLLCLIVTSFVLALFPISQPVMMVYSGLGSLLFCFYIIYDIQMIVDGKHHAYRFAIDEYVYAALHLYLDIINLFLHLLRMFGERR